MALFKKKPPAEEPPPPITLSARGAPTPPEDQANLINAKQSPGFVLAQRILAHALDSHAQSIILDYTAQAVAVFYMIDGFRHASPSLDRQSGDMMLAVLKVICALNMNERRAKQKGAFGVEYRRKKWTCKFTSQGTPTGERVFLQYDDGKLVAEKLENTGMREKMEQDLRAVVRQHEGLVLVASPPASGLSVTFGALLRSSDRYIRNWCEVGEVSKDDLAVENVPMTTYDAAAGETPMTVLPKLLRTYPDVVTIREFSDTETAKLIVEQINEEKRLVLAGIRAKDCCEAIVRLLMLKVPQKDVASALSAVLCQRLVRVLCDDCKQAYAPQPQVLQQLGIPAGKVQAFYMQHEGPLPLPPDAPRDAVPMPCRRCHGIGFRGRTAIYELLIINDRLREVIAKTPKLETGQPLPMLREEARKAGMRTLQEEGIALVAKGTTSLPELLRVLKE